MKKTSITEWQDRNTINEASLHVRGLNDLKDN